MAQENRPLVPGKPFFIGRNDVPGTSFSSRLINRFFIGFLIVIPKFPFQYIIFGKLPVFRLVFNAFDKGRFSWETQGDGSCATKGASYSGWESR